MSLEKALLALSGVETEESLRSYQCKIERILQGFLERSRWKDVSHEGPPPLYLQGDVARNLFEYLWVSKPRRFGEHFLLADVVDAQMDPDVKRPVGTCVGLTVLYSVLGVRAGLNLSLLVSSGHVLNRLKVGPHIIDMDHTDPLGFNCQTGEGFREFPLHALMANVLNSRGLSREQSGCFAAAAADYRKALEFNPEYPNALNNRGNMRFREADFEGAIRDYTKAIRLSPAFYEAYCNRGMAWQRLGNHEAARRDYQNALRLDAGYADAKNCLLLLDRLQGRSTNLAIPTSG